jgi:molybdenum cofactor cytidylyltransferase
VSDIGIVLLAAGEASRFGSAKQATLVKGVPLVRRAAMTAIHTGAPVTVVTGAYRDEVESLLDGLDVALAFHPDWRDGLGSSIALGVRALLQEHVGIAAVMIMLADQALVDPQDLQRLIDAHRQYPGAIVAASFDGVLGPPCLFSGQDIDTLRALSGPQGARALLQRQIDRVHAVTMPHAAVDIDTPDDLARLD